MSSEKMTIEVNMGNLDEDEREQFQALIEKANTPPQKKWWEGTEFDISDLTANFAHVVNGDWAADWDDSTQAKYFIVLGYNHKWKVEMGFENRIEGVAYFKSEELAWRCVHEVILPFERGEL